MWIRRLACRNGAASYPRELGSIATRRSKISGHGLAAGPVAVRRILFGHGAGEEAVENQLERTRSKRSENTSSDR